MFNPIVGCETSSLRALNVGAITLICLVAYHILGHLYNSKLKHAKTETRRTEYSQNLSETRSSTFQAHSALNVALFPPLFFFSALYYTDVISTLAVLLSYLIFVDSRHRQNSLIRSFMTVAAGVLALLFRQTNVFWVAVFPAGLAVVDVLADKQEMTDPVSKDYKTTLKQAWTQGRIYDIPVGDAGPQGMQSRLACTWDLTFSRCHHVPHYRRPRRYEETIANIKGHHAVHDNTGPLRYVCCMEWWRCSWWGQFSSISEQGLTLLGDKSAHVATVHLPQMLYVWPYVIFFSLPLALRPALSLFVDRLPSRPRAFCLAHLTGDHTRVFPGLISSGVFILGGLAAVHFNTIVHPYTLADNRHYVFYVFRILLRHPAMKYLAVPVYWICAFLTITTLNSPATSKAQVKQDVKDKRPIRSDIDHGTCKMSFVTIWVVTTTLSVATAPLVEPRYFIIPWIIWRLHVPYLYGSRNYESQTTSPYDVRLILETIWLLAINTAVGYNFLYRSFTWPSEPGNTQRFLW